MQRLGFTQSATIEHRKLAVDLAEVIIEWQCRKYLEDNEKVSDISGIDNSILNESNSSNKMIDKTLVDSVVNFLFRIACQVNEASSSGNSPGENLSKRCFKLLQTSLKSDCWPHAEIRVAWLDKLFALLEQSPNANFSNITVALEILAYLCSAMPQKDLLSIFKPLQRGIMLCVSCSNLKVAKSVHTLLHKLFSFYPIDGIPGQHKVESNELDTLYTNVGTAIYEGLISYERSATSSTTSLYGPVMLLKAACSTCPTYLDKFLIHFMKAIQKMQKDHVSGQTGESTGLTDLLIDSLELVKTRMTAMHGDMHKIFLTVLTTLIEKSPETKLLKALTSMVDDWMRTKTTGGAAPVSNVPSLREKSLLAYRMMLNFEKRFSDDQELHQNFLEIVSYVYKDKNLAGSELTARLEPAFLAGLKSVNPTIREKFMEVFDNSMKKKLFDRLMYIISSQNWEPIGKHYWLKQCLQLLLNVADENDRLICSSVLSMLPSCKSTIQQSTNPQAELLLKKCLEVKEKEIHGVIKQEVMDIDKEKCDAEVRIKEESKDGMDVDMDEDAKDRKSTISKMYL
jgi:transformation/transcription domain-associated protein